MPTVHFNILAVIVAAAAAAAIGALWYSPLLFAKQWVAAYKFPEERLAEMRKGAAQAYAISAVCFLIAAFALAALVHYMSLVTVAQGLKLGLLVWLGFAATIGLTNALFTAKPMAGWFIDAAYQLVYLLVMGVILAVWR